MKTLLTLAIAMLALMSCEKQFFPQGNCKTVYIDAGEHHPKGLTQPIDRLPVLTATQLKYDHIFLSDYYINDQDSSDWNKLPCLAGTKLPQYLGKYGLNAVMFGYRYMQCDNYYQIGIVINHRGRIVVKKHVGNIFIGMIGTYQISQDSINVYFDFEGSRIYTWNKPENITYKYVRDHYFGGDKPAPSTQEYKICYYP